MMIDIDAMIRKEIENGYGDANAQAKVCQDLILKAIATSSLNRNVTIKGGVVMRGKTKNVRRATQDIDLDFIRYSLGNDSIDAFVSKLNCIEGLTIKRVGKITELKQQDYHGKRIFVRIKDQKGFTIENKQPYTRCDTVCIYTLIFITVPGHVTVEARYHSDTASYWFILSGM